MKGGLGTASITLPDGMTVGALVVCTAWGNVVDPDSGTLIAGPRDPETGVLTGATEMRKDGQASGY